jgi:hypothetical protein
MFAACILLAGSMLGSGAVIAGCDECYGYSEDERAYEREYQRELAEEYGYREPRRGQSSRSSRQRTAATQPSTRPRSPERTATRATSSAGVDNENSSITAGSADRGGRNYASRVATVREVGCKSFFPSVGMTLSVPCE